MFRTCLAIPVHANRPIAIIIDEIPCPKSRASIVTTTKLGTDWMISIIRCMTISTFPPIQPEIIP